MTGNEKKPVVRAAVLHDMCSVGKAAMTNILPVLSVMGIEACPVPTMIFSTHTGGYGKPVISELPAFAERCALHLKENEITFDHIFVGYLGNTRMIENIEAFLKQYPDAQVLLDPIMADHGSYYRAPFGCGASGDGRFDAAYGKAICRLIQYSSTLTPNYTESCFLSGEAYEETCTEEKLHRICGRLSEYGAEQIVISSVPLPGADMTIAVYESGDLHLIKRKREGRSYPGTGDLFAAVLKGYMIRGNTLPESVKRAHGFVCRCIQESDSYGYPVREGVLLEPNLKYLLAEEKQPVDGSEPAASSE